MHCEYLLNTYYPINLYCAWFMFAFGKPYAKAGLKNAVEEYVWTSIRFVSGKYEMV